MKFKCDKCGEKFDSKKEAEKHEKNCKKEISIYYCKKCGKDFYTKKEVKKHEKDCKWKERKSPVVAVLLNLVLLGAGFMYLGQVGRGFKYLIVALLLSWTFIAPVIMLIMAMVKSYELAGLINSGKVEIVAGKMIVK